MTAFSRQPSDPRRLEAVAPSVAPATALKEGFTNSLGMKFVPVKGTEVLFCVHETRYKDYAAYAADVQGVNEAWKNQTFDGYSLTDRSGEHPVTYVNWSDGQSFAAWLSKKENRTYRLPTDEEWSIAVGVGRDERWKKDTTPATVFKSVTDFPWGSKWPPLNDAGNYGDQSRKGKAARGDIQFIEGMNDGFPTTAIVMSYTPNKLGIFDLGGNLWEWCRDWYDNSEKERVLRGGSWKNFDRPTLLSSARTHHPPDLRSNLNGFRLVVETRSPSATTKPGAPPPPPPAAPPPASAKAPKSDVTNSLGMKFVKVPDTKVMFCIHETRRQDYAAYAAEVPGVGNIWKNQMRGNIPAGDKDDHPVIAVSWNEAQEFCQWLSKKEVKTYRLPTDQEWSFAVGIGKKEKFTANTTPALLSQKLDGEFPWGGDFPPRSREKAGNYGDTAWRGKIIIAGYTDGYATTAPVMSFKPNKLGIYDLGGNVWEWCDDWFNAAKEERVLRGGSWLTFQRGDLLSSHRNHQTPDHHASSEGIGFRIVVEMTAP